MMFVLDASLTLSWCFPDEATEYSRSVLDTLDQKQAIVPAIWPVELTNVLHFARQKQRITRQQVAEFFDLLAQFRIEIEPAVEMKQLWQLEELATTYRLSVYDASYLEIALRRGIPIATLDQELLVAAKNSGTLVSQ